MKYSFVSFLLAWIFPTRKYRNKFRNFCKSIDLNLENISKFNFLQKNYKKIINRLKKQLKYRKIKVIFLINEESKWKVQSLYDLMLKSEIFEPIVALTIADIQNELSSQERIEYLKNLHNVFLQKGIDSVYAYDFELNTQINLDKFKPDIVFYQQPWGLAEIQSPQVTGKYALTCYIPYYVPNYGILSMECKWFHKFLFRYYVLNKDWEDIIKDYSPEFENNTFGIGHTMLDNFYLNNSDVINEQYVIYAPHWSICHENNWNKENYSTFDWSGELVLDYAKKHPEIKWVFKPHPTLKVALKRTGWTDEQVQTYYNEWAQVGLVCDSSNYIQLFKQSKAMITDCASFLVEYFCTGKPVVHLISEYCKQIPPLPTQKIFNTFYKVRSEEYLSQTLDNLLIKNIDNKKDERLAVLNDLHLTDNYAAKNIIKNLEELF